MGKYLLVLSGENPKLALEEAKGVLLQDENVEFLHMKERIVVFDSVLEKEYLRNRLAYTNIIADFVDVKLATEDEVKKIKVEVKGKFAIDQKTIEPEVETEKIMKALADTIDNKVDLDNVGSYQEFRDTMLPYYDQSKDDTLIYFFESLGALVKENLIDIRMISLLLTYRINTYFEPLKPYVEEARKSGNLVWLSETEYLYHKLHEFQKENPDYLGLGK